MQLKRIDLTYSALSDAAFNAVDIAVKCGDVETLSNEIREAYGEIVEVIFITGPYQGRSILVFADGNSILVGASTAIGILTHGYTGQGPEYYSRFLGQFGFSDSDATRVSIPSILTKDGRITGGIADDDKIVWSDGQILPFDFLEQYERLWK